MAGLRRVDSSSASPLIRVAPILLKQRNAFVALGAVGLSLGAAWAWSNRRKPDASDLLAADIAPKAKAPQKRHRSKRHKSKTVAPAAECGQDAPLTECAAETAPLDTCSPPANESRAAPAPAAPPQPAEQQQQPPQAQETSQAATPQPEKMDSADSDGEPTASSTGCTQELDVDMADVATVVDTSNDATQLSAEPAAGEWRTVERKQRRRRPSPPADFLDEPEPEATTAASPEATTAAEPAVAPPAAELVAQPKPLDDAEAAPTGEAECAPEAQLAATAAEGGTELSPKKVKKKKKRAAPPASLRASEDEASLRDEAAPAVPEPESAMASPASELEAMEALADTLPPPPAAEPPPEVWVEVTSRRRNKRPAAQEPRSPRSSEG